MDCRSCLRRTAKDRSMIWDSCYWKDDLLKSKKWLKEKIVSRRRPSEKRMVEFEKCIFITAYQVRKLIEAKKVSNSLVDSTLPITKYGNVKNVTLMNWHRLDELNNLKAPETDNISIKDVCNQLIHSYVFVAEQPSFTAPIKGVFFSSDRYKNKVLFHLRINDWISLLDRIGRDYPNVTHSMYDFEQKDYFVVQETMNDTRSFEEGISDKDRDRISKLEKDIEWQKLTKKDGS